MKYFLILILGLAISSAISSCTRGYYNTTQDYYDYEESFQLIHDLKDGILIVQIPYEKRKFDILKRIYEKEPNPEKKASLKEEYDALILDLKQTQKSLILGTIDYYKFSDFAFVPDTLINEFKKGERKNIFLDNDLSLGKEVNIDTSKTILFLRDLRDYDNLFIHKFDGTYPPAPFPYTSQVPTGEMDRIDIDSPHVLGIKNGILRALYTVNKRLTGFYTNSKFPNKT